MKCEQCPTCVPGATAHHWAWHMSPSDEATCWCQPFLDYGFTYDGAPLPFHRISAVPYGFVFWDRGEHGPQFEDAWESMETFRLVLEHEKRAWQEQLSDDQVLALIDQCARPMGCTAEGE